jgi:hypothetical protein
MHYTKYLVHSPLFALRDARLSEQVLAAFAGVSRAPLAPAPAHPQQPRRG